jgi:hypothetical protein
LADISPRGGTFSNTQTPKVILSDLLEWLRYLLRHNSRLPYVHVNCMLHNVFPISNT